MALIDLTQMKSGDTATVKSIKGGFGMVRKLETLGIRPGVRIKKVSAQFMKGPVIVRTGNTQVAIGFGMAHRVLVEIEQ
ncbi:MAG TPA: ferrous iron transport protein A [candidate division WOR-3 bacterium]|uniref:Ferrous iron transport protein A n=1 Tax=candidate division WOR-3 bacterium TaxID=2052148 RepID=A0A9C9EPJ3_UNCW3|nr:ferrous iron transport protein A [candidate division WOR-3 bacterium]